MTAAEAREFLEAAYVGVFRRAADPGGLEAYATAMQAGMSATDILRAFLGSAEFRDAQHARLDDYDARLDPLLAPFRSSANEALAEELCSRRCLDMDLFERLHEEACRHGYEVGKEYPQDHLVFHKRRFAELLNACCYFSRRRPHARVLDVGNTQNLAWYKAFLPGIELVAADRPGGPDYADSDHRIRLDLNTGDLGPLNATAPYNLIVFTEVLEHLSVSPVLLLRQLVALLATDGVLYLTTPNFFRSANLAKNPAAPESAAHVPCGQHRSAPSHARIRDGRAAGGHDRSRSAGSDVGTSPIVGTMCRCRSTSAPTLSSSLGSESQPQHDRSKLSRTEQLCPPRIGRCESAGDPHRITTCDILQLTPLS